jgi:uncharacterized protein (DUF2267 family)
MARSGALAIDRAEEVAHAWMDELGDYLNWSDDKRIFGLLRASLHAIRDFLSVEEAAQLAAQLPVLIRGVYFEGWNPTLNPAKPRHLDAFMGRILEKFPLDRVRDREAAVAAVIRLLGRHVSPGEMSDVRQAMRKDIRFLFPEA